MDKASRVSLDSVEKTLKEIDSSLEELETELKNSDGTTHDQDDKFEECMSSFAKDARNQYSSLQVGQKRKHIFY